MQLTTRPAQSKLGYHAISIYSGNTMLGTFLTKDDGTKPPIFRVASDILTLPEIQALSEYLGNLRWKLSTK